MYNITEEEVGTYEPVPPKMLPDDKINIFPLMGLVKNVVERMFKDDYCEDNDDAHYIYEEALKTFYGVDVFEKINKRMQ